VAADLGKGGACCCNSISWVVLGGSQDGPFLCGWGNRGVWIEYAGSGGGQVVSAEHGQSTTRKWQCLKLELQGKLTTGPRIGGCHGIYVFMVGKQSSLL